MALQTPGARELREPIQRSAILKELNDVLPPSGPILQALARFDPFPSITGPSANVPAAGPEDRSRSRRGRGRVAAWFACSARRAAWVSREAAGWPAAEIVVTNAHVVAGQDDTTVQVGGEGPGLDAEAIWFDPRNDLSILRVPELSGAAGAQDERERRVGHGGRRARLPAERPVHGGAGAARPRRPPSSRRTPTGAVRCERSDHVAARPRPAGQLGRAGRSTARDGCSPRSSPRPRAAGRTGYGVPDTIVRDALRRARGTVDTGACAQ